MAVNLLAKAGFKNVYNIVDGMEGDAVKDPDSVFHGPATEERLEELGVSVDVRTHCRPNAAPERAGLSNETGSPDDEWHST